MSKKFHKTSLFFLLKEYADSSKSPSSEYIESDNWINSDTFLQYFNDWMNVFEFFQYETCNRYYDGKNLRGVLYPYEILKNEYYEQEDEFPNASLYVYAQLNRLGISDWREESKVELNDIYSYYTWEVTNDTLGEIARQTNCSIACILLNCNAINGTNPIVLTTNSKRNVVIEHCSDIASLHQWFSKNRKPQRVFVYNPKHGDNKHMAQMISGTQRRAAQLEVSRTKAQELLKLAIGIDPKSPLWLYDKETGKYIYFENQQEERLAFHGYHLQTGEENFNNIDKEKLKSVQQIIDRK